MRDFKPKLKFTNPGKHQLYKEYLRVNEYDPDVYNKHEDKIDDALSGILKKYNLNDRVVMEDLLDKWSTIFVGPIGKHTEPIKLYCGILHIAVDNTVWLNELKRYNKRQALEKLQEHIHNEIKDIIFELKTY
jgi:predicted nucleic acid-binding Zn ribbon protein